MITSQRLPRRASARPKPLPLFLFLASLSLALSPLAIPVHGETLTDAWPQWGGPQRDFTVSSIPLDSWPEDGPRVLWRRPLGEGYSAISVVDESLYTQYREGDTEVVLGAAVSSGKTLWEMRYDAPIVSGMAVGHGRGPHSTPLVHANRLFTIGSTGRMHALATDSGEVLWQQDLWTELGGTFLRRGYGASPIAWRGSVLVTLGGDGQGIVALDQKTGKILWRRQDLDNSQSSPILIEVDGQHQLVAFVADEVVAVDPDTGQLLWRHEHRSAAAYNITTPVWDGEHGLLFLSSSYGGGARVLRLDSPETPIAGGLGEAGKIRVEEVWHHSRFNVQFTNVVKVGEYLYGSSGRATAMLQAVDLRSGDIAWRERAIARANFVVAGDRVLALEEDGRLLLLRLTPEHPSIVSQTQLFDDKAWTVPTLIGRRLYVRSNTEMMALELPGREEASVQR